MPMDTTLYYLFDPLCGWCYGAAPAISGLRDTPGVNIVPLPTGLFSGEGGRPMDDGFAAYAWSNDQRIERLTGQRFSDDYRRLVLDDRQQRFDSGAATLALTAVSLTAPGRELDALAAVQHARYVDGRDVTSVETLSALLGGLGLDEAAARLAQADTDLLNAARARIDQARAWMHSFHARGVPTLIAESGEKRWMLDLARAYAEPGSLARQLRPA